MSYHGILLSNKKERIIDTYGMDQSPENWAQSQSPKVVYCIVSFIEHIWNEKIIEMKNKLVNKLVRVLRGSEGWGQVGVAL